MDSQNNHECVNFRRTEQIQLHPLAKDTNTCNTIDVERDNEEAPLSELVSQGQVIAVHAVGQDHDYFYLKVPEKVKILNS